MTTMPHFPLGGPPAADTGPCRAQARTRTPARILRRALAAGLLAWTTSMPAQAEPASPLATADQRELDARAMRLKSQVTSAATMQAARIAYGLSRLAPASREAAGLLDRALDELSFSALLKAINGDPLYPKVHWMNAPPRDWFCTHVAGSRYAFDNPDNVYRTIPIEGGSRYIVKGRRSGRGPVEMTFSLISNVNAQ